MATKEETLMCNMPPVTFHLPVEFTEAKELTPDVFDALIARLRAGKSKYKNDPPNALAFAYEGSLINGERKDVVLVIHRPRYQLKSPVIDPVPDALSALLDGGSDGDDVIGDMLKEIERRIRIMDFDGE